MTETAKLKVLDRAPRCRVLMLPGQLEFKLSSQDLADAGGVVPEDGKPAASFWPVGGECANDHVSARTDDSPDALRVCGSIARIGQKVESRAIMPYVIDLLRH